MQKVSLLHASLPTRSSPGWAAALLEALPYARRLQLEGVECTARLASLGGLALALTGAARLVPPGCRVAELVLAPDTKPRFVSGGPAFSISHVATRVGCALAVGLEVGLDLEAVPDGADVGRLVRLRRWTAIEATLKAAGCGVRHAPDVELADDTAAATLDGVRFQLRELRVSSTTLGHLATVERVEIETIEVALDGRDVSAAVERALGLASQGP